MATGSRLMTTRTYGRSPAGAALAAEAALLVAAERRRRVELVVRVLPHDAGLQAARHGQRARALVGPHAGGQAVGARVGLLDRLGLRAERQHRHDRAEDLLDGDPVGGRDVGEQRRREPVAALGQRAGDRAPRRALALAGVDQRLDPLQLRGGVDRADVGVLVERVADAQQAHPPPQLLDDLLGDALLQQQPRAGAAHVALVEEDAVDDALDGLVERGVVEHDVGGLAAELEREADVAARGGGLDVLADLGRAGERDLVDVRVADQRGAGRAVAGDDVHDAVRQLGLLADLGQQQRGQRRRLGRLEHRGVAARERRGELPGGHQQREVPRHDLADDAHRLGARGRRARTRACRPSRRSRRSARRRAGRRRRATRGSACRRRATRRSPARGRAPGSAARSGTRTCRARARAAAANAASAARAAATAASTSASPACAISASGSSVAGLIVGS